MSLSSRAIAVQGIGFGVALLVAVQGFAPLAEVSAQTPAPGGGSSYRRQDTTQADIYRKRQIKDEGEIVAILSVLIHEGIL